MFNQVNAICSVTAAGFGGKQASGLLNSRARMIPTAGSREGISAAASPSGAHQQAAGAMTATPFDNLKASMRSVYNLCSNGPGQETPDFARQCPHCV